MKKYNDDETIENSVHKKKSKRSTSKEADNVIFLEGSEEAGKRNAAAKKKNNKMKIIIAALAVVFAVVAGIVAYRLINREYKGYSVEKRISTSYENTANYEKFNGNLFKYTPDGASYINSNGDTVWSAGINMGMPIAVTSGKYAVVADIGGNSVCVFNTDGQVSSLTMPYTICDVDIADQGAFAVVLESDKTNYINLYDKNGNVIYEIQTTIDKSGYPLDITISDDAEKLFTSYIKINGTSIENNLAAYNFGSVGQNTNADRIVGGYMYTNQVIPKLEFVDNDTVIAFGTKSATIFSMSEKPSITKEIEYDREIRSVFYSSKFFGYIQEAEQDSGHLYELYVFDLKGKKKFDRYIDFEYNNIYAVKKELIISGGDDCLIVRSNGRVKYNGKLSGNIVSVVPSGARQEYVVVYDDMTEIIKLKKEPQNNDNITYEDDGINYVPNPVGDDTTAATQEPQDIPDTATQLEP